jgi:hypothetical protein
VLSRSRRPGSANQQAFLNERILNIQQQNDIGSNAKIDKKAAAAATAAAASEKSKSKTTAPTVMSSYNNATTVNDTEIELEQNPEFLELPPKNFVVKEYGEFFKPKIHVEMDNPDKLDTVTEVHVKGWKLEKHYIDVFSVCLPAVESLNTLK